MAEVRLENVRKHFLDVVAVADISLTIADREFLTLVGPSGCGKSTTLRMIAGLERLTGGDIYFDDKPVGHLPANKRDIAMVFQSYALYPHMSVFDNIGFALKMMRVPKDQIKERVKRAAKMLNIEELLYRKPKELSGGQRQRVALGRSIVRDSSAYLLDEPLSNLDAKLRVLMRAELKNLHLQLSQTFIYVTHDQSEAMTMSDRIAVMDGGRIQQCASPLEIYNRPVNQFVAGFMGNPPMNFVDGSLNQHNGTLTFEANGVHQPIPQQLAMAVNGTSHPNVVLGIRPEDVTLSHQPVDGAHQSTLFVDEPLGAEVLVTVDLGGTMIRVRTTPEFRAQPQQNLWVKFNPDKMHLFAADDGRALRSGFSTG